MIMLRARINGIFILGIDRGNIERLLKGEPILVALAEMGGTDDVLIMAGETLKDIQNDLEKQIGKLPEPTPYEDFVKRH